MQKAIHGITVAHFFDTYREKLKMDIVTGEAGLHRLIREGSINRPSLALTGFFKYFANKRVQVLGAAEMTYLKSLSVERQNEIFHELVNRHIPCLGLTRNFHPTKSILEGAEEPNLPLIRTPFLTIYFV